MKVIVAGYAKTGTKTLCASLRILGYNVYDFLEHAYYLHKDWNRIFDEGVKPGDFERMYKGVDAVTDGPCFYYWEELSEAFPQAKIILMLRDEDSWYESVKRQAEQASKSWTAFFFQSFTLTGITRKRYIYNTQKQLFVLPTWPRTKLIAHNANAMKQMYREHNLYVQTMAPKDKLLVYKVSDGWKPLCDFLGVEIPDEPFPHKNKSGKIMEHLLESSEVIAKVEKEFKVNILVFATLVAIFLYVAYMWIFE